MNFFSVTVLSSAFYVEGTYKMTTTCPKHSQKKRDIVVHACKKEAMNAYYPAGETDADSECWQVSALL